MQMNILHIQYVLCIRIMATYLAMLHKYCHLKLSIPFNIVLHGQN